MENSVRNARPSSTDPVFSPSEQADRWARLRSMIEVPLPLPGAGHTIERWRALAELSEIDLALAKVYESHVDAVAIVSELYGVIAPGLWAVFAAEPPGVVLTAAGAPTQLTGQKAWCSAAAHIDHALVTCVDSEGLHRLVHVDFDHAGIGLQPSSWAPAGMSEANTIDLVFEEVPCHFVGGDRAYLDRPGFWHGAIGIAACWYGASVGLSRAFRSRCMKRADTHALVHLGAIDASLRAAAAALRDAAAIIDRYPKRDARHLALACRATIERSVEDVLGHCGRALGAGPLCRDRDYAKRVQDLTVFVRQSHAERDLATLGECCVDDGDAWRL